jgi:putative transposase
MKKIVKDAIDVYNNKRPHYSNYMLTPKQMHAQTEITIRTNKRKNSSKKQLATA